MEEWNIGLEAWIIQDGNYGDFTRNEVREFALEFSFNKWSISEQTIKNVKNLKEPLYKVNCEVIFKDSGICIIDFGLLAYNSNNEFENVKVGDYLSGEIYLGVDKFSYFERFNRTKGIPPLIYSWKIKQIFFDTTPRIEMKNDKGRTFFGYDESRYSIKELERTYAWSDEERFADYTLNCSLLNINAKHFFSNSKNTK